MSDAARERPAVPNIQRVLPVLVALATLAGILIPLYGILYWQWDILAADTLQLLMLCWMETAIIACWTCCGSPGERGRITVNGRSRPASQFALVRFFALHGMFTVVHLIFLWAFFSHEWLKKVHGIGSFFDELRERG